MCYGCNGCNRCGKMDRLRSVLFRRLCFSCGTEAEPDDVVCSVCGKPLRPLPPKPGVSAGFAANVEGKRKKEEEEKEEEE